MTAITPTTPTIMEGSGTRLFNEQSSYTLCKREFVVASRPDIRINKLEPKIILDITPENFSKAEEILLGVNYKKESHPFFMRLSILGVFNTNALLMRLQENCSNSAHPVVSRENLDGMQNRTLEIILGR